MADYVKVAVRSEIPPGTGKTVDVKGRKVALFNVGGVFHAIDDTCRHRGGPLGEGTVEGNLVTCPWHGWQYDLTSGQCATNPAVKATTSPVKLEGDDVLVAA